MRIIPARAGSTGSSTRQGRRAGDHPRSRGEHHLGHLLLGLLLGSSPLTRGAPVPRCGGRLRGRIIPAHAGSTRRPQRRCSTGTDHPRSRGEHSGEVHRGDGGCGSSPLTRGARTHGHDASCSRRIIPAHAGSTGIRMGHHPRHRDHPRSRGEHPTGAYVTESGRGSSPLTRGARNHGDECPPRTGIIPAHAGSTFSVGRQQALCADHPRSRGEHEAITAVMNDVTGSSPLTRGAPAEHHACAVLPGIIPAHAGSTWMRARFGLRRRDHPRSRGEHQLAVTGASECLGSSPLTRGARNRGSRGRSRSRDHPRSRGEHFLAPLRGRWFRGSSPLTRGARAVLLAEPVNARIIPAHAGSTIPGGRGRCVPRDHPRSRGEHRDE